MDTYIEETVERRYQYTFTMFIPQGDKTLIISPSLLTNTKRDEVKVTEQAIADLMRKENIHVFPRTVVLAVVDLEENTIENYKMLVNEYGLVYGKELLVK